MEEQERQKESLVARIVWVVFAPVIARLFNYGYRQVMEIVEEEELEAVQGEG